MTEHTGNHHLITCPSPPKPYGQCVMQRPHPEGNVSFDFIFTANIFQEAVPVFQYLVSQQTQT